MKISEIKFEDYLKNNKKNNLHPELNNLFECIDNNIEKLPNLILYGVSGIGKYTQALKIISKFSKSNLKYERKINVTFNKKNYIYKISDIHFEIDFNILGCNAKILWNDIYYHILDIIKSRSNYSGIILCKNFHKIHHELCESFHSYLQNMSHENINVKYIILAENMSFLPKNILNCVETVSIKRPSKSSYNKCFCKKLVDRVDDVQNITNIKNIYLNNYTNIKENNKIADELLNEIYNFEKMKFFQNRDILYNFLIYQHDIYNSIWYMMKQIMARTEIKDDDMMNILFYTQCFLKYYNNNYRPIFHLEKFLYLLCSTVNGL
tara:strand:- start:5859 stop:6824 length:966 start_codon:yes stop_codon:yes gene_type:complete